MNKKNKDKLAAYRFEYNRSSRHLRRARRLFVAMFLEPAFRRKRVPESRYELLDLAATIVLDAGLYALPPNYLSYSEASRIQARRGLMRYIFRVQGGTWKDPQDWMDFCYQYGWGHHSGEFKSPGDCHLEMVA